MTDVMLVLGSVFLGILSLGCVLATVFIGYSVCMSIKQGQPWYIALFCVLLFVAIVICTFVVIRMFMAMTGF